jgi:hypothetical protein
MCFVMSKIYNPFGSNTIMSHKNDNIRLRHVFCDVELVNWGIIISNVHHKFITADKLIDNVIYLIVRLTYELMQQDYINQKRDVK